MQPFIPVAPSSPKDISITVEDQKAGVIKLIDPTRLPPNAVEEAINLIQADDGRWRTRPGTAHYGAHYTKDGTTVTTTNLCPNPSFETNTTSWASANGATTLSSSTTEATQGTHSLKIVKSDSTYDGVSFTTASNASQSTYYTAALDLDLPTGVSCDVQLYHSTLTAAIAETNVSGTGDFQRVIVSGQTRAEDNTLSIYVRWATSDTGYIDAVQLESGDTATDYFDGSFTDVSSTTETIDYAWTGTANASTSTRAKTPTEEVTPDGIGKYVDYATDGTETTTLITAAQGKFYKSTDGGSLTELTGATYTSGSPVYFLQNNDDLYMATGFDDLVRYSGGSTVTSYSTISAPTAGTATKTGLTSGSFNMYYQVVAINAVGSTTPCTEMSVTSGIDKSRDNWTNGTDSITITWTAPTTNSADVLRYEIYASDESGFETYLDSVTADVTTYVDDGQTTINPYIETPNDNTTTGPRFRHMTTSQTRIWATGDPNNPQRVYWAGLGQYAGTFSPFYGGGWVDLDKGGPETTVAVSDYRDGRGTPLVTVLTSAPDGSGSIWAVPLGEVTVGSDVVLIPQPQRIQGLVGTNAPRSLVQARDNIFYFNKRGLHTTGSKANLVNVLSTDEVSANIRPYIDGLNSDALDKVASYVYQDKIFISVPSSGSDSNNQTIIFDLARRNWAVYWTVGFSQFLEYTDSDGVTHFLGIQPDTAYLIEISDAFHGDNGTAFNTSLLSGLIPISDKDRTKWAKVRYAYIETVKGEGSLSFEVLGTEKKRGYGTLASGEVVFLQGRSPSGMGGDLMGGALLGGATNSPTAISSPTTIGRIRVNKLVNNIQFRVSSTGLNDQYTVMRQQAKGYEVPTRDPSSWVI